MNLASWFVHPWFLSALGLVAIPILIHLVHRLRYRRVRWSAMEFLLASHQQNRRRLRFENLLLLMLRCLIVVFIVLAFARPSLPVGSLFQAIGKPPILLIILDDSYSMEQSVGSTTAFDHAHLRITRLLDQLARRNRSQEVVVITTSRPDQPLIERTTVSGQNLASVTRLVESTLVAKRSGTIRDAVEVALSTLIDSSRQVSIAVVSDFQARDWQGERSPAEVLRRHADRLGPVLLIDTVETPAANISLTELSLASRLSSAEVPMRLEVAVVPSGRQAKDSVIVRPSVDGAYLPGRPIEEIAPTGSNLSIEIRTGAPGWHALAVETEPDALAVDDVRHIAVETPTAIPVLIVDGTPDRQASAWAARALNPGKNARTGFDPEVISAAGLSTISLSDYRLVLLVDVPRVQPAVVESFREYLMDGGGLAVFVGDRVDIDAYNQALFADGQGILPAPMTRRASANSPPSPADRDWQFVDHPILAAFAGERSSYFDTLAINEWIDIDPARMMPGASVIARHREGAPLWIEQPLGKGRVLMSLTDAAGDWNSWPQNPTYVVVMLMMAEYLSKASPVGVSFLIGEPWDLAIDLATERPNAVLSRPSNGPGPALEEPVTAIVQDGIGRIRIDDTLTPGVYRLTKTLRDGSQTTIARAYNVDPAEGVLTKAVVRDLDEQLSGIDHDYLLGDPDSISWAVENLELKDVLLAALVLALIGEQLLRYRLTRPANGERTRSR